jgi:hypothetical protein
VTPWLNRPSEIANLLNPAFCGYLVSTSVKSYQEEAHRPMPLALCALVLPLVLHKATRESLPKDVRTSLLVWLERHQDALVEFPARVERVLPFTRESILFSATHGTLQQIGDGFGIRHDSSLEQPGGQTEEVKHCIGRARFVGKWFAQSGDTATVYHSFGIRP